MALSALALILALLTKKSLADAINPEISTRRQIFRVCTDCRIRPKIAV